MDETRFEQVILQREIDRYTEALVEAVERTLTQDRMNQLKMGEKFWRNLNKTQNKYDKKSPMKANQFSNFLGAAKTAVETSHSPASITNWITYQMARDETKTNWGKTGLGQAILSHIQEMGKWTKVIAQAIDEKDPEQMRIIHCKLIALYAGYLRRSFIAKGGSEK